MHSARHRYAVPGFLKNRRKPNGEHKIPGAPTCRSTSASSWTAMAAGPKSAVFRANMGTGRSKDLPKIVEYCDKIGLQYLTVYAFSLRTGSGRRTRWIAIMQLLEQYVDEAFAHREENQNARTRFVGDLSALNPTCSRSWNASRSWGRTEPD